MRKPSRKTVRLVLTVTVPKNMTATQTRREVRALINDQCNYMAEPEDVRVRVCRSLSAIEGRFVR